MLYNLVQCPHRVAMDLHGDPANRDPISSFVQLLWERGHAFEQELVKGLDVPYVDLYGKPAEERERLTAEAMERGEILIHGGRLRSGDLLGDPDLLRRKGDRYLAGDIKSGAGKAGNADEQNGKPKKHYAVQLALYVDLLEQLGKSAGRFPFIWDVHGEEVVYDLDARQGPRTPTTFWSEYLNCLTTARAIATRMTETLPALSAQCRLCHWRTACLRKLEALNDPTLVPGLGRSKRDALLPRIASVPALAEADLEGLIEGRKTVFTGISPAALRKFQARAVLQTQPDAKPYAKQRINLPASELEIFFDIETDPLRDVCYLHGFLERRTGESQAERYIEFFADEPTRRAEEEAFAKAWQYVRSSGPSVIYYYSPYERTYWKALQEKYPHVATEEEIEAMFKRGSAVDLYLDVVSTKTEWPTRDHSIKTLASYLGFRWRDTEPSGMASIEWYHKWVETKDPSIRQRILEYNEDDCIATRVLLDAIRELPVQSS
jgi:predicted RecB family nuclease